MKKSIVIIILMLIFLIIYFVQANFFNWFTIAGIKPNLFVVFILFISLFTNMKVGIGFGLLCGIFLDLILGKNLGTNIIMLTVIAILGGYFDKNFSKDSRITIMLMVIGSTVIFELGAYIFNFIILKSNIELIFFIKTLFVEVFYNSILIIILYPIIQKTGYKIEDIFKGQDILTKYFS